MIAILLCCEGPDDQGRKKYIDGEYIQSDGVMQILIKKTSGRNDLNFVVKQRRDLKTISIRKKYLNKQQMTSLRLARLAQKEKCTHIAYHRDEDNKGFAEMYDQVKAYFKDAEANNTSCLAIVPQHMTESWLLSDKNAFKQVFKEIPSKPALPSKPEETWGNKGTDTHPKKYLERVLAQYHTAVSSEIYAEIAGGFDVGVLRKRCPESFGQFYTDMQSFITTETAP
jgi:hypothetical protein